MTLFRQGLLSGLRVVLAGPGPGDLPESLRALGAEVEFDLGTEANQDARSPRALVVDSSAERAGAGEGLRTLLDELWVPIEAVVARVMIPAGVPGKVVLIAPALDAGDHAGAAASAIVNLARTLSVEWARHGITVTAITPGSDRGDLVALVAYVLSPGGDYFSGCRFELSATPSDPPAPGPAQAR